MFYTLRCMVLRAMKKTQNSPRILRILALALSFLVQMTLVLETSYATEVIKIAVGIPLTGPLAKQGQEVANAVKLAAEEWNERGGVLGARIEVLEADDQGNPQMGVTAAEKIIADPAVMGVVYGITSVTCIPASEKFEAANLVMISPGCTNPKVTDRGLKVVNRVCARDDAQGPAGAIFAVEELKAKKIAIFDDGTTGPRGAADEFEKKAKELGAQTFRFVIKAGDKDLRSILGTVPKDVQVIYASLWSPEASLMAKQLPEVGLDVRMIGPDGQFEPVDYIQASGGAAEGNYVSFLAPDMRKVPEAAEFVKKFEAQYGPLSSYGPLAYEAANIILTAIQKVGKADRAAIRDAVRATKDYRGILGVPISFDEKGDVAGGVIYFYQVKNNAFEQVKTIVVK
ncbi:MAG TPA: branched-chain amino acid ABC transporter substrate-binding protein [Candidatus Limnocylindrales bacterium]|nr:branched-chain amino acid ABC transporter substrate-binding protein [Candidatus Limnocylindrales bacterium]